MASIHVFIKEGTCFALFGENMMVGSDETIYVKLFKIILKNYHYIFKVKNVPCILNKFSNAGNSVLAI